MEQSVKYAAGGAIAGGLALKTVGLVVGVSAVGPTAGGLFAAAQAAGWMGVPVIGYAMAGAQSVLMTCATFSTTGAAIGAAGGAYLGWAPSSSGKE